MNVMSPPENEANDQDENVALETEIRVLSTDLGIQEVRLWYILVCMYVLIQIYRYEPPLPHY